MEVPKKLFTYFFRFMWQIVRPLFGLNILFFGYDIFGTHTVNKLLCFSSSHDKSAVAFKHKVIQLLFREIRFKSFFEKLLNFWILFEISDRIQGLAKFFLILFFFSNFGGIIYWYFLLILTIYNIQLNSCLKKIL